MGRDLAHRMFARMLAVLGLAAITAFGIAGTAGAAPADRAGDPVVLTGSQLTGLTGTSPGKILAYKWNGKWIQVPVQIDERHTVDARTLYPEVATSKYIYSGTFDLEVYADPKTRSGADENENFDADDELVFMAGDSGSSAPSSAVAPPAVISTSATKVAVEDPVGGGRSFVYLVKAPLKGFQSAGKDYVDYDFNLTGLANGETLLEDYGHFNSPNPEDSTVKTANYELHSTDRWMEDEMKISTAGASATDILDREAVSAGGLGGCGRSEYTFSGNWDLDVNPGNDRPDDDDEGSYLAIIDGPVRAIRSYIGANSGPFVESTHKYYADHEDKSIHVRVHPIPDMYVWTDFSEAAIGMTYRDQVNQGGFPVDGNPDAVADPAPGDIANGKYFWQQLSGPQGSVTTLVAADASVVDEDNPDYVGYYLDDSTPVGGQEKQCGGDLKAYGASGFGIDGTFPNTDPVLAPIFVNTRDLSVNRVRYFGGPNATAAEADQLRARTQDPLTAAASKATFKKPRPALNVRLLRPKAKARPGKLVTLRLRASNIGNLKVNSAKVCVSSRSFARRACFKVSNLAPGKGRTVTLKPRVRKNAKGKRLKFSFSYSGKADGYGITGAGGGFSVAIKR